MADVRQPATGSDRPTVLVVGDDEPMDEAICTSLDRHGLDVERVATLEAVEAARIAAPDLVLLVGDAARSGGETVLARLAQNPATQVVPVVLLSDDAELGERFAAFRHGAVAVVPRSASVDEMARKVADIGRELPERRGEQSGELGEATLDELMKLVKQELRSGILSVEAPGVGTTDGSTSFRLVLGAGKPVAQAVEAFVAQLRPLVSRAEPLRYELLEHAGARFGTLDAETGGGPGGDADLAALRGLRVVLVVLDPVRSDALATELRARGATVAVMDATGRGLERARGLDPEVVIIDSAGIEGSGFAVVKACRRDPRLRWASMLVAEWEELWPEGTGSPDMARLASRLAPLIDPDRTLAERARTEASFDTRLELVGPSRLLRALARAESTLHITVRNPRCVVDVDLSQGLVVGAVARREDDAPTAPPLGGQAALAALLALGSGRVRVERRANPQNANVMAPVEQALALAAGEEPPLPPSMPPPSLVLGFGQLGGAESAPPPPAVTSSPTFEEAPTTTLPSATDLGHKRTLVGQPVVGLRAAPAAKPLPRPQGALRPKTMLGLAPAPEHAPPPAPAPPGVAAPSVVAVATALVGAPTPEPGEARLPLPARVPDEAAQAAAASPAATVPPHRRGTAPLSSPFAPAFSPAEEPPHASIADVILGATPGETPLAPPQDESFLIPDANMIPSSAPLAAPLAPARGRRTGLAIFVGIVAFVLVALAAVGAAFVLPAWLASSSSVRPPAPLAPLTPRSALPRSAAAGVDAGLSAAPLAVVFAGGPPDAGAPAAPVAPPLAPQPPVAPTLLAQAPVEPPPVAPPGSTAAGVDSSEDPSGDERGPDAQVSVGDRLVVHANRVLGAGDMREAELLFLRALAVEPRNPHALAGLARLHLARRSGRQALAYAEQAVAVRPRRSAYRVVLGDALALLGRRGEAQRAYREALRMDPRNRQARDRLGGGR